MTSRGVTSCSRNGKAGIIAIALLTFVLCIFTSIPAGAQAVGATLLGTVTDAFGAVISGEEITIKDIGTGVTRTLTSDFAGGYSGPNLLPGTYSVTHTAPGVST